MTRIRAIATLAGIFLAMLVGAAWFVWQTTLGGPTAPPPRPAPPGATGAVVPELVSLEPGANLRAGLPQGWSERVLESATVLESGDLGAMPSFARNLAERFYTAVLADVRPRPGPGATRYALHRLGTGLGLVHDGKLLVVELDSLDRLGIALSVLEKLTLGRAQAALGRGRLAARTATFVLYDASVEWSDSQTTPNRSVYLRYGILVDPETGSLRTVVWPVAAQADARKPPESLVLMPRNLQFACGVNVKAERALGGLPVGWKFAIDRLPPGEPIPMSPELQAWSTRDPATPEESVELEAVLRKALRDHGPAGELTATGEVQ